MDKIEKLYQNYEILAEAKDKISEHEAEYMEILHAVKGSYNEKRLASQFIARFFKDFPHLADKAIDAQLDLCEDEDIAIRKQAIKDLPSFCKDSKEYVPKIADVLAQMLQADDSSEITIVHSSLMTIFKLDAKGTLYGLFAQIASGEDVTRKRSMKFLCTKVKNLAPELLTKEIEEYILEECKKLFQDVTGQEFLTLMSMLSSLKISKTIPGQQALVDIITEQAGLDKEFDYSVSENIECLLLCIRLAMPYFSQYVSSAKYVSYICLHIIPVLSEIPPPVEGADVGLEILKYLAEMSPSSINLENRKECLDAVYAKLLEYMPVPPIEDSTENSTPPEEPTLQFSHIECIMYTFHQLAKHLPECLTDPENADRLRDLKLRLQYLAQGVQGYIKKLREALHGGKRSVSTKSEENKLKVIALRTTTNINTLIRDLFHNPPSYKCAITLSWKPNTVSSPGKTAEESQSLPTKRKERQYITYSEGPKYSKSLKSEREIYAPPSGKYSTKVKNFQAPGNQGYSRGGRGRARFY